ncbi:unnamed protein product, partial [Coregonus sp. 'balchen']
GDSDSGDQTVVIQTVVIQTVVIRQCGDQTVVIQTVVIQTVVIQTVVIQTVVIQTVVIRQWSICNQPNTSVIMHCQLTNTDYDYMYWDRQLQGESPKRIARFLAGSVSYGGRL